MVAKARKLSPDSRFSELVDGWLDNLGTTKPAANTVAAYRRDLEGVARRVAADSEVPVVHLEHLTKEAMRAAFASWARDHAAASILRAHAAWSSFFDFLVAEDLIDGNPMAAVAKPRRSDATPRAIKDPDPAGRLLATAAQADPRGRDPWPERDLALVATFCVTGIREAEAADLTVGSIDGTRGARCLQVTGKGGQPDPSPPAGRHSQDRRPEELSRIRACRSNSSPRSRPDSGAASRANRHRSSWGGSSTSTATTWPGSRLGAPTTPGSGTGCNWARCASWARSWPRSRRHRLGSSATWPTNSPYRRARGRPIRRRERAWSMPARSAGPTVRVRA